MTGRTLETTRIPPMPANKTPVVGLLAANAISLTGNTLAALAIPWFVLVTTGSAARTGVAAFAQTVQAILAAFYGGALVDRAGNKRLSIVADIASGLTVAVMARIGVANGVVNPVIATVLQERTPADLRGRVFGTVSATAMVATPAGMLIAGFGLEATSVREVLAVIAAVFVLVTIAFVMQPAVRTMDRVAETTDAT